MDIQEQKGARAPKNGAPVQSSRQEQIPGTEKGSKELRALHDRFAEWKYIAKYANEQMKALKPDVLEMMESEGIDSLRSEVEYGDEMRYAVTEYEKRGHISTSLEPKDDE